MAAHEPLVFEVEIENDKVVSFALIVGDNKKSKKIKPLLILFISVIHIEYRQALA